MHWFEPCRIDYITKDGEINFSNLNGEEREGLVNGSRLKPYRHS